MGFPAKGNLTRPWGDSAHWHDVGGNAAHARRCGIPLSVGQPMTEGELGGIVAGAVAALGAAAWGAVRRWKRAGGPRVRLRGQWGARFSFRARESESDGTSEEPPPYADVTEDPDAETGAGKRKRARPPKSRD